MSAPGAGEGRFVPAAGRRGLTRFYDSIIALTMREGSFRGSLEAQVVADLPAGARLLDVGAGTGTFAIALARRVSDAEVIAIEPDAEARALARDKAGAEAVEWRAGLAGALPLEDGCCDRVAMSLLLHHLDPAGKRAALGEAHRVLRPGGRLHVADWGSAQDPAMRSAFLVLQLFDGFAGTRDHVAGRLPAIIEGAGFARVERRRRMRTAWGSLELLSAARD